MCHSHLSLGPWSRSCPFSWLIIFIFTHLHDPVDGDFPHLFFDVCYFRFTSFAFTGEKCSALIASEQGESYSVKVLGVVSPFEHFLYIFNMSYFFMASWKGSKSPLPLIMFFIVLISSCSTRNLHILYLILTSFQDFENCILIRREARGHDPTFISLVTLGQSLSSVHLWFFIYI